MVVSVVSCGVIPEVTVIEGVTAPAYRTLPVPEAAVPIAKWVIVLEPPVAAGNVIGATGLAVVTPAKLETVQPPVVLATGTLA